MAEGYRFNPPPEDWIPPPDWQPDPSWGPPPYGWQLWLPAVEPSGATASGTAASLPAGTGTWVRRHKVWSAVMAVVLLVAIGSALDGGDEPIRAIPPATQQTAEPAPSPMAPSPTPSPPAAPATQSPAPRPSTPLPPTTPPPPPVAAGLPAGDNGRVTDHIDGDTLDVDGMPVRLIGVDTPETVAPGQPVECYGRKASAAIARLLPIDERVRMVYDEERQDRYGRDLAYLYRLDDGLFVNVVLVRRGLATTLTIAPNDRHAGRFSKLERQAEQADRGLWSACTAEEPPPDPEPEPEPEPEPGGGCEPGYDPCVPAYPPDVNCDDVVGPITVTDSDPHGLDGDGDGVACES
ncbi:MAG: thermonuclease family protein [Acidothermales bacterium]|nr:thermonuclease family protein [Acidothermales bacterium]